MPVVVGSLGDNTPGVESSRECACLFSTAVGKLEKGILTELGITSSLGTEPTL